jgi:hypothetical protein
MRSAENRLSILGGAAVAASGLLWAIPGFNFIAGLAGMVGLILIVSRLGYFRGLWMAGMGLLLALWTSSLIIGYLEGLYYVSLYAGVVIAPALVIGWASRNLYRPILLVYYGLMPFALLFLVFMSIYSGWMHNLSRTIDNIKSEIELFANSNPAIVKLIETNYGQGGDSMAAFLEDSGPFAEDMLKITPGFLVILSLGVVVFGIAIAGYLATRLGIIIPRFREFHLWRASGWWLLPTIAALIPIVFRVKEFWFYAGLNILIVTGHVYMVVGLSIVEAFFRRILLAAPIRIIFYLVLIMAGPVSMAFLAILGLADTKFNFKRETEDFENKIEE